MSTLPPNQLPAVQAKTEIEFTPFGSEDRIKLSLVIIQKYIAVPTRDNELPDERDCMKFMMLCRARRLNPFEGDAFLIGFRKRDSSKAEWSLITSISAFYKRAELHPEYSGIRSGVIVRDSADNIVEREGDFTFDDDKILGGWATVHFRSRSIPMTRKVKLATYQKPFGVWVSDPGGMICKVAECQALRDSFPTMCGGMYLREEAALQGELDMPNQAKRPDFGKGMPAIDIGQPPKQALKATLEPSKPAEGVKVAPEPSKSLEQPNPAPETGKEQPSITPSEPQKPDREATDSEWDNASPEKPTATASTQVAEVVQDPKLAEKPGDSDALASVKMLARKSGITHDGIMLWARNNKLAKEGQSLADLSETKLSNMGQRWDSILPKIREAK